MIDILLLLVVADIKVVVVGITITISIKWLTISNISSNGSNTITTKCNNSNGISKDSTWGPMDMVMVMINMDTVITVKCMVKAQEVGIRTVHHKE